MSIIAEWNFASEDGSHFVDTSGLYTLTKGTFGSWVTSGKEGSAVRGATELTQSEFGSGAYGPLPNGPSAYGAFSVAFWARMDDTSQGGALVSVLNSSGQEDPWAIYVDFNGSIQVSWYDSAQVASPTPSSITTGVMQEGAWIYIAVVSRPGESVTVYADGVEVTQYNWQSGTNAFYATWQTLLIGSSRWGSWGAYIDELRLFNEPLTDTQVGLYMNTPVGAPFGTRIRLGSGVITRMYLGDTPVERIYVGDTLVK